MGKRNVKLAWTVHLARRNLVVTALFALVTAAALAGAWAMLGHPVAWILVAGIFLASFQDFLLPIHYACSDTELVIRSGLGERRILWRDFRSYARRKLGVQLRRLRQASFLDAFRSVNVYYGENNEERVLAFVEGRLGKDHP